MADGHLNKCKDCTKKDVSVRYNSLSLNPEWIEKERARCRDKYKRLSYREKYFGRKSDSLCPQRKQISSMLRNQGIQTDGKEAHHWNYNRPYSVFILSKSAHHRLHKHIKVNYDDKYVYTKDGVRLESEQQATDYFSSILSSYGINEELKCINIPLLSN